MTNDYKEILLKYLTGNLANESQSTTLNYENLSTTDYDTSQIGTNIAIVGYLQCTDSNGTPNGKTLVYGYDTTLYIGFIALFEGTNLLYYTTEYNTGTLFSQFKTLQIDEEGRVYGIDYVVSANKYRFILLNNISELSKTGQRQVILRQSYYLQGSVQLSERYYTSFFVKKSPQSANYVIIGCEANYNPNSLNATLLKINVGAANEWQDFTINITISQSYAFLPLGAYIYFNNDDNPFIEFYYYSSDKNLYVVKNSNMDINITETIYTDLVGTYFTGGSINSRSILPIGANTFYLFLGGTIQYQGTSNYNQKALVLKYNGSTSICYEILSSLAASTWTYYTQGRLYLVNNIPTMYIALARASNTSSADQYVGIIPEPGETNPIVKQLPYTSGTIYTNIVLFNNLYNMFDFSVIYKDTNDVEVVSTWQIVYNPNNYNNQPYENTNSLIANNGLVFDTNDNLVFARNLYNYKVYNNRTISILNIPNNYLNGIIIGKKDILGETNKTLLEDTSEIEKNIYEDLYINFFTTLKMSNQNTNNHIDNYGGASRLNQSVSKETDYSNAKATKTIVHYNDGSQLKGGISATINNGIATYSITLYIPNNKNVDSIDILSEDENTIYQTIDTKGRFENNKYYTLTQDVHIE